MERLNDINLSVPGGYNVYPLYLNMIVAENPLNSRDGK